MKKILNDLFGGFKIGSFLLINAIIPITILTIIWKNSSIWYAILLLFFLSLNWLVVLNFLEKP
jgi:predicted Abi (CAAX) family protease